MAIFNKTFVKFAAGFGVIIFVAIGFVAYGGAGKYLQERAAKKAIAEYEAKLTADTYGGKTPEETLALFIDALKKGDIDLASKYYVLEKQEEELSGLRIGQKNGHIQKFIEILEKEKIGHDDKLLGFYEFITVDQNNVAEFSFRLVFNKYSNIWKIESL